jgi:oligopeptidase B
LILPKNHRKNIIFFFLAMAVFLAGAACRKAEVGPAPPVAEKVAKEFHEFEGIRVDDYYWLKERENPKVVEYLKAENDYLQAVMKPTEELQEKLYRELVGRIKQTDMSVPYRDNGYYYYSRYEEGKEYPVYCRKKENLEAPEEVLINAAEMAEGQPFFSVIGLAVSPNNRLLAYAVDTVSRRLYHQHFKDLKSGQVLADEIPNTLGMVAWANDNKTVFYTLKDTFTLRPYKIMKHPSALPHPRTKKSMSRTTRPFIRLSSNQDPRTSCSSPRTAPCRPNIVSWTRLIRRGYSRSSSRAGATTNTRSSTSRTSCISGRTTRPRISA